MASATTSAVQPLPPSRVLIVFGGLVLAMLLAALDGTIVATALPTIAGQLGGLAHLSWLVTAYLLAETIVTPLWGKLGDLFGRKLVLQVAIVLFLVGSALCGFSQSMLQLIVFRAIQGLGGGALMVTTQAAVGDIVTPRQRGRYQGIFGAAFGLASVAGPLLGGYLTTHLSWRWIFFVNLPVGIIALVVLAITLPAQAARARRPIDYAGAVCLAVALAAFVLLIDRANEAGAWTSPLAALLTLTALVGFVLFYFVERRAADPILPIHLFANRTVWVTSLVSMVVGFVMFGSITCLPLFLQTVRGESPLASGLAMLPLMAGMPMTSILSGQFISWTGRYKMLPIVGTATAAAGLFLLSRMTPATELWSASVYMFMLGVGLGLVLQVLMIAAQNAVDYRDLGVATSGAILFRFVGGSLGTAVLGTFFAMRLESRVVQFAPADAVALRGAMDPEAIRDLPERLQAMMTDAVAGAVGAAFLIATGVAIIGHVLAWLLPEVPLRQTIAAANESDHGATVAHAMTIPTDADSANEFGRGLAVMAQGQHQRIHAIITEAGVELSAPAACLLLTLAQENANGPLAGLADDCKANGKPSSAAFEELRQRGLLSVADSARITSAGRAVLCRLAVVRRRHLKKACSEWKNGSPEVAHAFRRVAKEHVNPPAK